MISLIASSIEDAAATVFPEEDLPLILRDDPTELKALAEAVRAGTLWVAVGEGNVPVGFAYVRPREGYAHLLEVDVHPDHGQRGLGTALVNTVIDWARAQDLAGVTLTTFRHLAWNGPFYHRLGFAFLTPTDEPTFLNDILAAEAAEGLNPANRVGMIYRLH